MVVDEEAAGKPEEPTPPALQAFYDDNPADFTAPEFRTFNLVVLENTTFQEQLDIEEEKIREIYDANRERLYSKPEKRSLYQIQFDNEAAAQAAVDALAAGDDFSVIAERRGFTLDAVTYSDIGKGDVVDPNVGDAAFAEDLAVDAVAGPIKGLFGYSVVQITDIVAPEVQSFEDVRDEIEESLLSSDTRKLVYDAIEQIESEQDTGASLVEAATKAGFEVTTVGPVDRFSFGPGGEIVADVTGEILDEAFSMLEGDESPAITLADDAGYYFISLTAVTPQAVRPYDEVADDVALAWRKQERDARIASVVGQIADAVAGGASFEDAVAPFDLEVQTSTADRRLGVEAFAETTMEKAFSANIDALFTGDSATGPAQIAAVVKDARHQTSVFNPAQRPIVSQYAGYQLDQELFQAYAEAVQQDFGVSVNQAAIDASFADGGS